MDLILLAVTACATGASGVKTGETPSTRLYIRTVPQGAEIAVDGKSLGRSDELFLVPPGVRNVTVELEGYTRAVRQVEVRDGWIERVTVRLTPSKATTPQRLSARKPDRHGSPSSPAEFRVGYVNDTSEKKWSLAGTGHFVRFRRPAECDTVIAVEVYASRYGSSQPPAEDFFVFLLDQRQQVIGKFALPYGQIDRGDLRWHRLVVPPTKVPEAFGVALSFDPRQTRGIFLGLDKGVAESHSYTGLPDKGFVTLEEPGDWMVRVVLADSTAGRPASR